MIIPKFSIIVPYGGEGDIASTISSILSQVSVHKEVIIVTRKGMAESVKAALVSEVNVVEEATSGVYGALNTGIDKVKGEVFCFLSSGAIFKSIYILEEYSRIFREIPDAKFVTSGWVQERIANFPEIYLSKRINSFKHFWSRQPINIEAVAIRSGSDFNLRFDETYQIAADYKFIRNLIRSGKAARLKSESVVLPPPGLSSNPQFNGESEVVSIRNEMLARRIGGLAPRFNLLISTLLDLPGIIRAWERIFFKKFKQALSQFDEQD